MKIDVGAEVVSAEYDPATQDHQGVFVCAHGAGGNLNDQGLRRVSATLRDAGLGVVRFNFAYRERGSHRPDAMPSLKACIAAVVAHARAELRPRRLIIGGRSMGGRAASMLAADGFEADGLLLLAYPLHPPGRTEQRRDAHLPSIRMPVLCFNGTRDAFCDPHLMRQALEAVTADWTMHWIDGADHGFHVLKRTGRTDADVFAEIGEATRAWIARVAGT